MVGNDHLGHHLVIVQPDRLHPRRTECLGDEGRRVLPPLDNVDLLPSEFVDHLANPGTPSADTGADRVDVRIVRYHGDLGSMPRFASDDPDLHITVHEFRNLEVEKRADEFGMATRDHDLGSLAFTANLEDVRLDAVTPFEAFVGDALRRRHDGFGVAEVEDRVAMIRLLHDAGDEITFAPFVQVVDLLALGVTETLQDDLFRRLGRDAPEVVRGVFPLLDDVPVLVEVLSIDEDLAGVRIDRDPGLFGRAGCALVGGHERVGERVENGLCGNALLSLEELQCIQQVVIHRLSPTRSCRVSGAFPIRRPYVRTPRPGTRSVARFRRSPP